jgi:hypothetical protein
MNENTELIKEARNKATGADIHDVCGVIGLYRGWIHLKDELNAKKCEKTLQLYINGVKLKDAKKMTE